MSMAFCKIDGVAADRKAFFIRPGEQAMGGDGHNQTTALRSLKRCIFYRPPYLWDSPVIHVIMPPPQSKTLMAKIQSSASRITVTDTPGEIRIIIPGRRSWFVICVLGFWICCWAVAEVMVASQFLNGDAPPEGELFMLVWFGVWTVSGMLAIYAWLWQVFGKEIAIVRGQMFKTRRDIGGFGFDQEYDLFHVRDLRVGQVAFNPLELSSSFQLWGIGGGVIVFDYGAKTHRFGVGLDEVEAKQAVTAIKSHRIQAGTRA